MPAAGSQRNWLVWRKTVRIFYLQKIDINKIMCYNPDKKFKEGACPFSCWVPNRTYLCDA